MHQRRQNTLMWNFCVCQLSCFSPDTKLIKHMWAVVRPDPSAQTGTHHFCHCLSQLVGINIFLWSNFFSNASVLQTPLWWKWIMSFPRGVNQTYSSLRIKKMWKTWKGTDWLCAEKTRRPFLSSLIQEVIYFDSHLIEFYFIQMESLCCVGEKEKQQKNKEQ